MPSTQSPLRWPARARALGLGAIILAGAAGLPAGEWQSLLGNTPFGQPPVTPTASNGELEFRGVVQEDGLFLVNLYNPATKTAQWIPVNGKAPGLEVKSYDAASDKVQITHAGRPLTLPLKQAHVALLAAAPAPKAEAADNPEGGDKNEQAARRAEIREMIRARMGAGGEGPPFMRNMPPEAQAMIEEFRRRRAEAAADQPTPPGEQAPARRQRQQ